jgi:glycosyltransferase involved in cell wall biosynthesis
MKHICLILEGTYPYVTGGVSEWTHSLISNLPEFDFSILHIYTGLEPRAPRYKLPDNVRELVHFPLRQNLPAVNLEELLALAPNASLYHSLSTGFAGLIGKELKKQRERPFLLTEHGIYWHEIEIGADEIECGFKIINSGDGKINLGTSWEDWSETFRNFARDAYNTADEIITVSRFNRNLQISLGAPADKCRVISNGVDTAFYDKVHAQRFSSGHPSFGLVARITPIKDILTYIKACKLVKNELPDAHFLCIGPTDQDPAYYRECLNLVSSLELSDFMFTHETNPAEFYRMLDVVVLSSISEGQPYALLEAMACGIPVIATEVGGCPELVFGSDGFGAAGYISAASDAGKLAAAMLQLVSDKIAQTEMGFAGRLRVQHHYSLDNFIAQYRNIYHAYLPKPTDSVSRQG